MKLRTRLALGVGLVSLVGGFVLGLSIARGTRNDAARSLEQLLQADLDKVDKDPEKNPAVLIDVVAASTTPMTVRLYFDKLPSVEVAQSQQGEYPVTLPELSVTQLTAAVNSFQNFTDVFRARYRALQIEDGQWVVAAVSMEQIDEQYSSTLRRSLITSMIAALLVTLIISQLIRRELLPIETITRDAQRIADGDVDVALPLVKRRNEIGQLSSSLRQMEESLRRAVEVTSNAEVRMREFLGDASHELRTPLTVIRGYIDILDRRDELTPEQAERAMSRLRSESRRMATIINDLLLLAEMGEVHFDIDESVDLSPVVSVFFNDLVEQQPERSVALHIPDGVTIDGSTMLIERMVSNIVSNIRQHTPATAQVNVQLESTETSAVLTVDDAGPGLPDALYERATEGFQRFDRHRSPEGGGFGLGLSIIASIVAVHRGTLELTRSSLGGLRMQIALPTRHTLDQ